MFLLLIVLITVIIICLRMVLVSVELTKRVSVRIIKEKRKKAIKSGDTKKARLQTVKKQMVKGASFVAKSGLKLLLVALVWIRRLMVSLMGVFLVVDIVIFVVLTGAAGGAFLLFYKDDANGKYTTVSTENGNTGGTNNGGTDGVPANLSNLSWDSITDEGARNLLKEIAQSWGSEVTEARAKLIILGATRIGHSTYSNDWGAGRGGTADNQSVFDCSSFVGWCYYKSGYTKVSAGSTTASFIDGSETSNQFENTTADKLIPGDVVLARFTYDLYNANHAGIYVGKDKNGTMLFMHCTSRAQNSPHKVSNGVRISEHSWAVFRRLKKW